VSRVVIVQGLLLAAVCSAAGPALAEPIKEESVGFTVPDSPAFTYLGTTPTKISRPGTARDLAVTLLTGVNRDGQVNEGLAIDVRPWFLIPGFDIPIEKYKRFWYFVAANAQVSLGTVQSGPAPMTGARGNVDGAIGFRFTLIDGADPMLDDAYRADLGKAMLACAPPVPGSPTQPGDRDLACLREAAKKRREKWLDDKWNAGRLSLGLATGLRAPGAVLGDSAWSGLGAWLVGGGPLGGWGQLIGQGRYDRDHLLKTNVISFGGRANVGTGRFNGFLEVLGHYRPGAAAGIDNFDASWSAGGELRVADHAWLVGGFGKSFATDQAPDPIFVLANIRWAVSSEARLTPTPP
jgi:hypothetical protein